MNFKIRRCIQIFLWIIVIGMFLRTAFWLKAETNQAQPMDPPLSEEQAEQQTQKGSFDLDGLKSVISAAGMLSFALGYINSAKRQAKWYSIPNLTLCGILSQQWCFNLSSNGLSSAHVFYNH